MTGTAKGLAALLLLFSQVALYAACIGNALITKASMMTGMDGMQKMQMSGDTDKDFAMMMKMHHQQALTMAEMELAQGKSSEMKGDGEENHRGPEERDFAVRSVACQTEVSDRRVALGALVNVQERWPACRR